MFSGAAGRIALSHVGGLPMIAGAAMGVGVVVSYLVTVRIAPPPPPGDASAVASTRALAPTG